MMKLAIVTVASLVSTPADSGADDPRDKSECLTVLAGALEMECRRVKANGLGIGLSLARQALEGYAGHIGLTSVESKGTSVTLTLAVAS